MLGLSVGLASGLWGLGAKERGWLLRINEGAQCKSEFVIDSLLCEGLQNTAPNAGKCPYEPMGCYGRTTVEGLLRD